MDHQFHEDDFGSQHHHEMAASALEDSDFESHSGFAFDMPVADEEFRHMHRDIASLDVLANGQQEFPSSLNQLHNDNGIHGVGDQYSPDFVDPFIFKQDGSSPSSSNWPHGHDSAAWPSQSMLEGIVNSRNGSVSHYFGQITPPNDEAPKSFPNTQPQPATASPPVGMAPSTKSERARNAANHRHAKAKRARKDSPLLVESPHLEDEDMGEVVDEDRRERYREKNRLAAAKCRAKKKVNTEDLEESARQASAKNKKLRAEERELRDLFSSLRDQALAHDPSQGCACGAIHSYNMHKAQETARGAVGLHGLMIPSPTEGTLDSASPSSGGVSSRAQSFSGMRPPFRKHPAASSSITGPFGQMPRDPSSATGAISRSSSHQIMQSPRGHGEQDFQDYIRGTD